MKNNISKFTALCALVLLASSASVQAGLPKFTWKRFGLGAMASYAGYWLYNKYGKSFTHSRYDVKKELGLKLEAETLRWQTDETCAEYKEIQANLAAGKELLIDKTFTMTKRVFHLPSWERKGTSTGFTIDQDNYPKRPILIGAQKDFGWSDVRRAHLTINRSLCWDDYVLDATIEWRKDRASEMPDADFGADVRSAYTKTKQAAQQTLGRAYAATQRAGRSLRAWFARDEA